jgi:hypothetical protein
MTRYLSLLCKVVPLARTLLILLMDAWRFLRLCLRPSPALAAENFFLRKQLALYQERHIKPCRPTQATRMALAWLTRWFDWRQALVLVQPATLIRWHRQGFRWFWRSTSRPGLNPTSMLPGAISLAETVLTKEYCHFSFISRLYSPIHGLKR